MAAVASLDSFTRVDSPRSWRGVLDAYAEPRLGRSLLDLGTSVVPYVALLVAMTFALRLVTSPGTLLPTYTPGGATTTPGTGGATTTKPCTRGSVEATASVTRAPKE